MQLSFSQEQLTRREQTIEFARAELGSRLRQFDRAGSFPRDLAYVMYTSGSTGVPKGLMHTHSSGLAYARLSQSAGG